MQTKSEDPSRGQGADKLKRFICQQGSPVTKECSMIECQNMGIHARDSPDYILQESMHFFLPGILQGF